MDASQLTHSELMRAKYARDIRRARMGLRADLIRDIRRHQERAREAAASERELERESIAITNEIYELDCQRHRTPAEQARLDSLREQRIRVEARLDQIFESRTSEPCISQSKLLADR